MTQPNVVCMYVSTFHNILGLLHEKKQNKPLQHAQSELMLVDQYYHHEGLPITIDLTSLG